MIDQTQLDGAKGKVSEALAAYNTAKSQLFTFDGKPIAEPAAHKKALAKLAEPVRVAVEKAIEIADQASAQVEKERLAPAACPTSQLNPIELEKAEHLAVFVREEAELLPPAELAERLQWVRGNGSKAQLWTYARYAKLRWQREQSTSPAPLGYDLLTAELRNLGAIGPQAGLSPESQRLADSAAQLRRWSRSQLASNGAGGTGRAMGI